MLLTSGVRRASPGHLIAIGGLVMIAACGDGSSAGGERQRCRAAKGDAPACAPGLVCMSDLCVRPPTADCDAVADALVSIELGNYAEPSAREALKPAKRALCAQQRVSADELACLRKATDAWAAATCVPRLYPHAESADCTPVMAKLRGLLDRQIGSDPAMKPMFEKIMTVMSRSCVEDEWPEGFRRCILASDGNDVKSLDRCEVAMPAALKDKLQKRISGAL